MMDESKLKINASNSGLLILHYINDIANPKGAVGKEHYHLVKKHRCIEHTQAALKTAREAGMLIVYVNCAIRPGYPELPAEPCALFKMAKESGGYIRDTWGTEVIDELKPLPNEPVLINIGSDCFQYSQLDAILRGHGITHIYLAGQVTEHVVATTARRGANMGYSVTILGDCGCGFTDEMHDFMINKILPFYATIATSDNFVSALAKK
jgi:nicotinamidase-related amidase